MEQIRKQIKNTKLNKKFSSDSSERVVETILTSIIVQARPLHLQSCLFYIKHFVFGLYPEMETSLDLIKSSVQVIESQSLEDIKYNQSQLWIKGIKLKDLNFFTNFLELDSFHKEQSQTDIFMQNIARFVISKIVDDSIIST